MRERGLTEPAAYLVIVAPHAAQSSSASASQATPPAGPVATSVQTLSLSTPHAPQSVLSSNPPPPPSHSYIEQTGSSPPGRSSSISNQSPQNAQAAPIILTQSTRCTFSMQPSVNSAPRPSSPRNPRSTAESPTAQSPRETLPADSLHSPSATAARSNSSINQQSNSQATGVDPTSSQLVIPVAPRGLCKECSQRESECVLLPCGHLALCFNCVQLPSAALCPVCRSPVHSIVRTFLA